MKTRVFTSFILVVLQALCLCAFAAQYPEREGRFIERSTEGWFFYEKPIEEIEEPEEEIVEPEPPQPTTLPPMTSSDITETNPPVIEGPAPLSSQWFRENMQKYRDYLFDHPSEEAFTAYMFLQKYMLDRTSKSVAFLDSAIRKNPVLDEDIRNPKGNFGYNAISVRSNENKVKILKDLINRDFGVWIFYEGGNPLTDYVYRAVKNLSRYHNLEYFAVSVDGNLPREFQDEPLNPDVGIAQKLNIKSYPALFLVSPEMEFSIVSQNLTASDNILDRIMLAARDSGWISEEQYRMTFELNGSPTEFADAVDAANPAGNLLKGDYQNPSNFIEPAELLKKLQPISLESNRD